eukprot:7576794-Ditylum_brightwellii.AAC.1
MPAPHGKQCQDDDLSIKAANDVPADIIHQRDLDIKHCDIMTAQIHPMDHSRNRVLNNDNFYTSMTASMHPALDSEKSAG